MSRKKEKRPSRHRTPDVAGIQRRALEYLIAAESGIRAAHRQAVAAGAPADDLLIVVLDLGDPYARGVSAKLGGVNAHAPAPSGPGQTLRVLPFPYRANRRIFSPGYLATWDRADATDIRVALLCEGCTVAFVCPADARFDEVPFLAGVPSRPTGVFFVSDK